MAAVNEGLDGLRTEIQELKARAEEINAEYGDKLMPDEVRAEWNETWETIDEREKLQGELEARAQLIEARIHTDAAENGAGFHVRSPRSEIDIWDTATVRAHSRSHDEESRMLLDHTHRAIEQMRFPHPRANREDAQEHIERLVMSFSDETGERSSATRHILATSSPLYRRAFGKAVLGGQITTDEQRALALAGASGGYAVPTTLDPTIIPTSNGIVNPWRQISRVESISGSNTWNGISAGAIVASRDTEFQEVSDDTPSLSNPTATVTKAQAFVPFSMEVGQDWGRLEAEMATLIQDAKDTEEGTAFATGLGTGVNPEGVLVGATSTVAAGTAAFAVANAYALLEALPPRFRPNGTFVASLTQYNRIRQLDTAGGANLWIQNLTTGVGNAATGSTGATFLGKPAYESSVMSSVLTAGAVLMVFGDFRYFLIVDRIGLTVEVIPHLFGATNQRPIGSRGLLAYWRNTSKVLSSAAFKKLVTT